MSTDLPRGTLNPGSRARPLIALCALLGAGLLSLASSGGGEHEVEVQQRVDETWLVANLYDGQTAVDPNVVIVLNVGFQDFEAVDTPYGVLPEVAEAHLTRVRNGEEVPVDVAVDVAQMRLYPQQPLSPNTRYELSLHDLRSAMTSRRMQPSPIQFYTGSAPRVTGLWRVEDTLIIAFSEPMDPDSLHLGHDSVDVLWDQDGELQSIASSHNLADYVWETKENLFLLTSIYFADAEGFGKVWVMVAGSARGVSGVALDGDGDWISGEVGDDFFEEVSTPYLPWCFTREDIPDPCVRENQVPNFFDDNTGWW